MTIIDHTDLSLFLYRNSYSLFASYYTFKEYSLKGPALPVEIKKKINLYGLQHPTPPMSAHKKFQPIRSSRFADYRQHIYENENER